MCGICGAFRPSSPVDAGSLKSMCDVIAHRGPDDAGYFVWGEKSGNADFSDGDFRENAPLYPVIDGPKAQGLLRNKPWNLLLGHRRLSVIDPSPAGHQPMADPSGKIRIVYNGELYNFRELRKTLKKSGHHFKSRSDTEVIVHAYMMWGIDCVTRFNGMFAFGLWDGRKKKLYLVRDRYGTKPLYYARVKDVFLFASEIKSILSYRGFRKRINLSALNEYFSFQNLFRYETLFGGVHLLPPATIAVVEPAGNGPSMQTRTFWDFDFTNRDLSISFEEAGEKTLHLFERSVQRQLVSDVPVGSFLSGGMDSGSITAIASRFIPRLTTFTAGFELSRVSGIESTFDERESAELMANEFKTQHYEQVINAGDIRWVMPDLVYHLEDLRVGMSYPNYYISRLASKFVKVCLSGAGGDELYGGYPWRYYRVVASLDSEDFFRNYYEFWQRLVDEKGKRELFQDGVYEKVKGEDTFEIFRQVFMKNPSLKYNTPEEHIANSLYFEIKTFLHALLLVGDKLSMASSLEERFPFLDNDLVDFAMRIPVTHKLKNLEQVKRIDENEVRRNVKYFREYDDGKNVLRAAMGNILPERVTRRKKQGFSAPDESWYRDENFDYIRETLLSPGTAMDRYIDKSYVARIIDEHAGGINHRLLIWSFICFEEWCRKFRM